MEHKVFKATWCRTFVHTREKDDFSLNALKIYLTPTPREGPFHENSHIVRVKMLRKSRLHSQTHESISLGRWCHLGENIVFVLGSYDHFSQCFTFFSQLPDHVIIETDWCWQSEQMDTGILLSPLKITATNLLHSPGTTSNWCLMRRLWNQNDSQRRLKTQVLIQEP